MTPLTIATPTTAPIAPEASGPGPLRLKDIVRRFQGFELEPWAATDVPDAYRLELRWLMRAGRVQAQQIFVR